jgi:hypothetical protein
MARQAASGRLAHQMWIDAIVPVFFVFSIELYFVTNDNGKSTSASRLHSLGIAIINLLMFTNFFY